MSIWDAFRGAPETKSSSSKKDCPNKASKGRVPAPNQKIKTKEKRNPDPSDTTDDEIILRMKAENAGVPWATVLAATRFKTVDEVKKRWNEVKPKAEGAKACSSDKGKSKLTAEEKAAKDAKNREEGLKKQAQAKEEKQNANAPADRGTPSTNANQSTANGEGTSDLAGSMKMWADGYDKKKWQVMASKHYDRTGQRITPARARQMAEEG